LHATVGSTAIVSAKGLAVLSLVVGLQGNALASLAQTWSTQAEFNNFTLTDTVTTSDGGGTITLSSSEGGASWSQVAGVPSLDSTWSGMSSTADNNVWLAEVDEAVQYNGSSWTTHTGLGVPGLHIGAIVTFAANDTWIFGDYGVASHWNGTSWSTSYLLIDGSTPAVFASAWGYDSDNIWAGADGAIFYYNGSTWTQQSSPGSCVGNFVGLSGTSTTDVWAANDAGIGCDSTWHYNGVAWLNASSPAPIALTAVYAPASGGAWFTDYAGSTVYYVSGGTMTPSSVGASNLKDIDGTGTNDIWAVGTLGGGYNLTHYNGSAWAPGYATLSDDLIDVEAVSATNVYAISSSILYHYSATTTYQGSGTATLTYTPQAGQNNDWTTASVSTTTPTNTTVTTEYSHNSSTWTNDLTAVPASENLYLKFTLATTDTAVTPAVNSLTVNYDPITATVTAPAAGSTNYANETGDTLAVTWTATGTAGADHIHLQYSTNSGGSWLDIAGATSLSTATTSYNWDTPDTSSTTVRVKVILEDASNNALASGASSADFTLIYDPTAPVLSATATSNGAVSNTASTGNIISITVSSDETLAAAPTATVGGLATSCTGSGTSWTCTRTVTSSDPTGSQAVVVSGQDLADNTGTVTANSITIEQPTTPPVDPPVDPPVVPPVTTSKPDAVQNLKTYIGPGAITLSYNVLPSGVSVRIWRSTSSTAQGELLIETAQNSYRDAAATIGVTYYYTLAVIRNSDQVASDSRTVSAQILTNYGWSISLSPRTVTVKPGGTTQLAATVYDAWGQAKTVPVTWSTINGVGSISGSGLLTATTAAGNYRQSVIATVNYQGLQGQASVDVFVDPSENRVSYIQISPSSVTLQPGQTKQYAVAAYNQNGTPLAIDRSRVKWTAAAGSITNDGLLTARTQTGTLDKGVTVTYTDSAGQVWQNTGRVTVSTTLPQLEYIVMSGHLRILSGQQGRYLAYSFDQYSNQIKVAQEPIQFSSTNPESGAIDSIGRFHAGQTEDCYYWTIKAERTLNNRSARAWSGVITKPYTQTEIDALNARNVVGFRQYQFTNRPGSIFNFSAIAYDGWGAFRPQTVVQFKLLDSRAGTITPNGFYTAGQQTGVFPNALQLLFVNTLTGAETPVAQYTLGVAPEDPRLTYAYSRSASAGPFSIAQTGLLYYDQYGIRYTNSQPSRRFSLLGSNSFIQQNGQIETGAPESLANSIMGTVDGFGEVPVANRGNLLVASQYAPKCGTTNIWTDEDGGTDITPDDDGGLIYFLGTDSTIPNTPAAQALQLEASSADKTGSKTLIPLTGRVATLAPWQEATSWIQKILTPLSALAILTSLPTVIAGLLQALSEILGRFAAGLTNLLQAITSYRRPRASGKVIDGRNRRPIIGATVQLLTPDTRQVVDTRHTDSQGQYVFLVDGRRTLLLSIIATGFKPYNHLVRGENIHRLIRLGLELERDDLALKGRLFWQRLFNIISASRTTLLTAGTAAWIITLISAPSRLLFYLGFYYLLAWLLELFIAKMPRPYGVVKDAVTEQPLDRVVVRFINHHQKIVGTEITDHLGRFRTILIAGVYTFTYSRAGYDPVRQAGAVLPRSGRSFRVDAELKRHVDTLTNGS